MVLINYDQGDDCVCTVVVDNEQVGYLAARHMLDIGCQRIAFVVAADQDYQPIRLRRQGVRRAMREAQGQASFEEIRADGITEDDAVHVGKRLSVRGPSLRPDGVIAATDTLAVGIIETLVAAGIRVPHDIAVMGCDRNALAPDCSVPLTSVSMKGFELGRCAGDLLIDEIEQRDTHVHQRVICEPELVVRASTKRD